MLSQNLMNLGLADRAFGRFFIFAWCMVQFLQTSDNKQP